ncbi:MAG: hypothetical protein AB7G11_12025, partial [Phycisphaerales bacterium]
MRQHVPERIRAAAAGWLVAGLMVWLGAGSGASAQMWSDWGPDTFRRPALSTRAIDEISSRLGLSASQRRAAESLVAAYSAEYASLLARADEVTKNINEFVADNSQPGEWYHLTFAMRRKLIGRIDSLDKGLLDDLHALLSAEQEAGFPILQRRVRRERFLRLAERGGPSIPELTDLMKQLRLDPVTSAAIAPALEQYEIDLDRELQEFIALFNRYYDEWSKTIDRYTGRSGEAPQVILDLAKDLAEESRKLSGLRRRHVERLQASVPPDQRAAFDAELNRRLYPAIFRAGKATRILSGVLELKDLDPALRAAVLDMQERYDRDLAAANQKWLDAASARARAADLGEDTSKFGTEERDAR